MKKRLAVFLTGIMICCVCGCANEGRNAAENSVPTKEQIDLPAQTGTEPEETQPSGESLPIITVESRRLQRWTEDETLLAEVVWDNMTLEGQGYEKAGETVRRLLFSDEEEMMQTLEDYAGMAVDQYEAQKNGGWWFANYVFSNTYRIARLDTHVLSVNGSNYDFSGGAHGYGYDWGITIDLQSGAKLELSRLAQDPSGFWNKAIEVVLSELGNRTEELYEDYESYVKENLESTDWYLDAAGIEMVFTPYEIGPYASGNIVVCIPYEEVASYLKPEYLPPQGEYIMPIPLGREVSDAQDLYHVLIEYRQIEEYMWDAVLRVNDQETSLGDVAVQQAYLLHRADDRTFLIFDIDWASDDYETFVYELTKNGAVEKDSVGGRLDGKSVNPEKLGLILSLEALGSCSSQMYYTLGEEGDLTPQSDIYPIEVNLEVGGLVVIREIPVTVQGRETMLPVDSRLHVAATNRVDTIWFEAVEPSGEIVEGEIYYERHEEDYQIYIDGVSEYEYFESLPYAG